MVAIDGHWRELSFVIHIAGVMVNRMGRRVLFATLLQISVGISISLEGRISVTTGHGIITNIPLESPGDADDRFVRPNLQIVTVGAQSRRVQPCLNRSLTNQRLSRWRRVVRGRAAKVRPIDFS